jgi:hypothetical protein
MIVEACSSFSGPQSLRYAKSIVRTLLLIRREPASRFIHLDLSSLVFVPKELNTRSTKHSMFMQVHFQPQLPIVCRFEGGVVGCIRNSDRRTEVSGSLSPRVDISNVFSGDCKACTLFAPSL